MCIVRSILRSLWLLLFSWFLWFAVLWSWCLGRLLFFEVGYCGEFFGYCEVVFCEDVVFVECVLFVSAFFFGLEYFVLFDFFMCGIRVMWLVFRSFAMALVCKLAV